MKKISYAIGYDIISLDPLSIIDYFNRTDGILFSNSQWPESYERYSVGNKYYEGVQDIPH